MRHGFQDELLSAKEVGRIERLEQSVREWNIPVVEGRQTNGLHSHDIRNELQNYLSELVESDASLRKYIALEF